MRFKHVMACSEAQKWLPSCPQVSALLIVSYATADSTGSES